MLVEDVIVEDGSLSLLKNEGTPQQTQDIQSSGHIYFKFSPARKYQTPCWNQEARRCETRHMPFRGAAYALLNTTTGSEGSLHHLPCAF